VERSSIFASRIPSRGLVGFIRPKCAASVIISPADRGQSPRKKSPRRPPARASMRSNGCCSFLKDSRNASQVICDAFPGTADPTSRSVLSVAEKPQAAAIRAEARIRELITTGRARSVSPRASSVPAGASGVRRERPGASGDAFVSVAFAANARRGTGRDRRCDSSQGDSRLRCCRRRRDCARHCSRVPGSARSPC
jgi:hypothetical protein